MPQNNHEAKSLAARLKALKAQFSFEIAKQPEKLKKSRTRIIVRSIIIDFLFSIFAFSLKGAQFAIQNNLQTLTVILLAVYFSQRVVESAYAAYADYQSDTFQQLNTSIITKRIMKMTCISNTKVYQTDENGVENVMEHAELIDKSRKYVDGVWNFWWHLPIAISQIVILIVMIIGTFKMEMSNSDVKESIFLMSLLIVCIIIYFVFGKMRIDIMKKYRKSHHDINAKKEAEFAEINHMSYMNEEDMEYHIKGFRNLLLEGLKILKTERYKLNVVFVKRSIVASGFMLIILFYKLYTGGEINEASVLGIVAVSAVYSTILNKIGDILKHIENTADYLITVDKLYPDFNNIYTVYCEELKKAEKRREGQDTEDRTEATEICVGEFEFSYNKNNNWKLINRHEFKLHIGDVVLVYGETGCGKSTAGETLSGRKRLPHSPVRMANGEEKYLRTLTYNTDRAMANHSILNEIVLSDTFDDIDKAKLLEILDGLELKKLLVMMARHEESLNGITDEDELVIELMKIRTYKQFSSGQQQRITLAKLLYIMDDSIQAVWLDEAFNRLNDEMADSCVRFILDYLQRDRKRLVLIASHQVSIIRPYCSEEISFDRCEDGSSVIKFQQL